jgi:hypothetical protein
MKKHMNKEIHLSSHAPCSILPDFLHHIIRKVAFFKELDGIGHVVSLDCNLVSGTVAIYLIMTPENIMTSHFAIDLTFCYKQIKDFWIS